MEKLTEESLFDYLCIEKGIVKKDNTYYRYNKKLGTFEFVEVVEGFYQWLNVSDAQLEQLRTNSKEFEKVEFNKHLLDNLHNEEVVFVVKGDKDRNKYEIQDLGDGFYVHYVRDGVRVTLPFEREFIETSIIIGKWQLI